jgi:hypothetical protein
MFVHMKKIPAKTADALDLIIEFATLGEYGLEYPEQPGEHHRETTACADGRRRPGTPNARGTHSKRLADRTTVRNVNTGARKCEQEPRSSEQAGSQAGNPEFASALRPPRIQLSFSE